MHIAGSLRREIRLMRKELRTTYKAEKARLRQKYQNELYSFYKLCGIPLPKDPPKRSRLVEMGNAVSHGIGALLSFVALGIMLAYSETRGERIGAAVYFFGLFIVFSSSCLYHAMRYGSTAKRIFRRFDYASVYILIGATFCPIIVNFSMPFSGASVLVFMQWTVIALGVAAALVIGPERFVYPHITLYLLLGWSALLILPFISDGSKELFYTVLAGGILYTLGVIPCAIERRAAHFIWHLFVLAGAGVQCVGVLKYIYIA